MLETIHEMYLHSDLKILEGIIGEAACTILQRLYCKGKNSGVLKSRQFGRNLVNSIRELFASYVHISVGRISEILGSRLENSCRFLSSTVTNGNQLSGLAFVLLVTIAYNSCVKILLGLHIHLMFWHILDEVMSINKF